METNLLIEYRIWGPQRTQSIALSSPAFELFFGGAKGGGKSDFLIADFLTGADQWGSAWRGVLFRREYKELEEIIQRTHDLYGKLPGVEYKGGDQRTWYFPSRNPKFPGYATLKLRNLRTMDDVGEYNGHQYTWIGFDELTEYPYADPYLFLLGCCRSAAGAPCRVRSSGNPGRPGHAWVKARFIDVARPLDIYTDPQTGLTRTFVPSRLEDNEILMRNDPGYERRLLSFQPHLVKALRWGDWDAVVGQVFSEFSRDRHVIPRIPLNEGWYKFCAMDWGYRNPYSIGWWAVSEEGRMIRYKEMYGTQMPQSQLAKLAWDKSIDDGVTVMVADPSCWSKDSEAPTIAETFAKAGFEMVPANNDRKLGLQRLHDMFTSVGADGRPMLLVMEHCRDWIRTVPLLVSDPSDPEDVDTEMEDHAYDETRYAIMSEFASNPRLLRRRKVYTVSMPNYDPLTYGIK